MATPPHPPASWFEAFVPFSLHHLVALLANAALATAVILFARRRRGTPVERRVRWAWGVGTLVSALLVTVVWMQPERYRPDTSWPLHLCDLAAWLTLYAMLSRHRWPRTMLYFWGVGLSTQAFITPTVEEGLASPVYWLFWAQHLGVVGAGFYFLAVDGYRPAWRDLALAGVATVALGLAMIAVNLTFDTNYMYTGNMLPERPTLLDALGPWPWRLVWLAGLALLAMLLTFAITHGVLRLAGPRRDEP